LGNFEEGKVYLEKGLQNATKNGHLGTLGFVESCYGFSYISKGDGKLAIEHQQKGIRYYEESQLPHLISFGLAGLGWGYFLNGDYENASKSHEKGIKLLNDLGISVFLSMHYISLSYVLYESGDLKNAYKNAENALKLSQKTTERFLEGNSSIFLGRILGKMDPSQRDKAEEFILQGIKILDALKIRPWISEGYLYLGEIYIHTDQKEKALENLKKAEANFREMGMDYWLNKTQEVLDRI